MTVASPSPSQRALLGPDASPRAQMARAFDELIQSGPLTVAFQPVIDIVLGETIGYEVLGRSGPLRGPLTSVGAEPASLLRAARSCGRLLGLDRRWRSIAIDAIAKSGDRRPLFFINVDPRVTDDPAYTSGFTRSLVDRHGLDPHRFVLELTESHTETSASIEEVLAGYREDGFAVALDDLGAPMQGLGGLLRVRPDYIKLDADLVRGLEHDRLRQHLLRSMVELAERTDMKLIVEGIESEAELHAVRETGARLVQGFLLGRPQPAPRTLLSRAASSLRIAHASGEGRRARSKEDGLDGIARLVDTMGRARTLESSLQHVAAFAAGMLEVDRVSVRLLDESRKRLLVAGRAGSSLHTSSQVDFAVGEGLVGWVVAEKTALLLSDADHDPRFATKPGLIEPMGSFLGVPLLDSDGCIGVIATSSADPSTLSLEHERRLKVIASVVSPQLQVARLRRLVMSDALTGTWNRRGLDDLLAAHTPSAQRPMVVAAVDIDRFKSINDVLGHAAGDDVLRRVAGALVRSVRDTDHVVRMGGDEFLLLLADATVEQAAAIAERARTAVVASAEGSGIPVTISVGIARTRAGEDAEATILRADSALYRAKERGRARVERDPD